MSREIKFRQPLFTGGFHYWGWIVQGRGGVPTSVGPVGANHSDIHGEQYTGLKDKNGTEIYEGDIVKQFNGLTAECKWDSQFAGFVYDKEGMVDVESSHNCVEVIGNIYENPELLEDK